MGALEIEVWIIVGFAHTCKVYVTNIFEIALNKPFGQDM
jgi:hypothetical protein